MRKKDSHKGENGKVLIIAGDDFPGAAYFSAMATLRMGADLVTVASTKKTTDILNIQSPDILTTTNDPHHIIKIAKKYDVVIIGPGIKKVPQKILNIKNKKILDAGALHCNLSKIENAILTPHQKEYENIETNNNIVVLKGRKDLILTKDATYTNTTGNEGMTVGGTGDILTGIIAGYLIRGETMLSSAKKGIKLNGKIGDLLLKEKGYGFIASDFIEMIPKVKL